MGSLIGDAALSETGVFSFPFHSKLHISWAAADLQTLEFLIFVVFIALGFFCHPPH